MPASVQVLPVHGERLREGDQGLYVRVALLGDVGVEALPVAQRVLAALGDHHGLGFAAQEMGDVATVVLDDDLDLLGDVGGVELREAGHPALAGARPQSRIVLRWPSRV